MLEKVLGNEFFKEKYLKKDEILFDEGDLDENIYIVKKGILKIEKYFSKERKEKKFLATLKENDIFGEGSINNNFAKEVIISATTDAEVIYIEAKNFKKFLEKYSEIGFEFLNKIIDLSNKRLLEANFILTSNYKIGKIISTSKQFSNKILFQIIDEIAKILNVKYIIYVEINEVMKDFANVYYDSRNTGKMLDKVIELKNQKIDLESLKSLNLEKNNLILELKNGDENIGFLVIGEEEKNFFSESQKKSISSIGVLLAGFIKQKQETEKNKD